MNEPTFSGGRKSRLPLWVKIQGPLVVLLVLIVIAMFTGVLHMGSVPDVGGHGIPGSGH